MTKPTLAEVQAIYEGMTKGEWKFSPGEYEDDIGCFVSNKKTICDFGSYPDRYDQTAGTAPSDADINAITVSVNHTFGAGINPVVVPEMLAFIEKVYNNMPAKSSLATEAGKIISQAKLK